MLSAVNYKIIKPIKASEAQPLKWQTDRESVLINAIQGWLADFDHSFIRHQPIQALAAQAKFMLSGVLDMFMLLSSFKFPYKDKLRE